jgi:hypothetical protein
MSAGITGVFQHAIGASVLPYKEEPQMASELSSYPAARHRGHLRSIAESSPHLSTAKPPPHVQATVEVQRTSDRSDNVAPTSAWRQF